MALEGTLNYLDVANLLQVVGAARKSGLLEISCDEREARLLFDSGSLVCAESNRHREGVGTLLIRAGLLTEAGLGRALEIQRTGGEGRRLGTILSDEFGIQPQDIEKVLRSQFEEIAFDVFSWPGARFLFHFTEPSQGVERFRLDPAEFIGKVGIQAGLLAEQGVEREMANPRHPAFDAGAKDP